MKTSTHLTRSILRAILANRPYEVPGCMRHSARLTASPSSLRNFSSSTRRHVFGLGFGGARRSFEGAKSTPGNLELALGRLVDVARARRTQSRLPPEDQIVDAFKFIFTSRQSSPRRLTRNEIFLALETFKHLEERDLVLGEGSAPSLSSEDLYTVLQVLALTTGRERFRSDTKSLANSVFAALQRSSQSGEQSSEPALNVDRRYFDTYLSVLSQTGSAGEALELLNKSGRNTDASSASVWLAIIRGYAAEGRSQEMWMALEDMQDAIGPLDAISHETLVTFFAGRDDSATMQKIWELPLVKGHEPTTDSAVACLEFCARHPEFPYGQRLADLLLSRTDTGTVAPTLLLWAAIQDPSPSHIRQTIHELHAAGVTDIVTMATMHRLIRFAYDRERSQLAREYLDLANSFDLRPDASTLALRLDHQLKQQDIASAALTFDELCIEDVPEDRSDLPVLNRFVAALAFSQEPRYELLMRVVDRLLENGADLEPEAIAGLCRVFLLRDDLEEATGLLRHRVDSYPMADRARISAVFQNFIVDPAIEDQRAYNAYELFRHALPETSVADRLPLMQSFFNRNRPDLACLVFGHMRQREDLPARPTPEAYAQCFEGIARCKDVDGLQMVYNMLKLDLEVEQTTRVHNGLMAAYTATQQPFTAIIDHFWKILDSREGPTLSSFILALRACELWIPQGGQEARRLIAMMQSWNLIITKEIYDSYIGALAGQSEFENVVELIEEMENDIGERPDAFTIGTFYNAIPWQYRKDEVEKWAKQAYPDLWEDLLAYGEEIDEEWEVRYFKIDRRVDMEDDLLFGAGEYHPKLAQHAQAALEMPETS